MAAVDAKPVLSFGPAGLEMRNTTDLLQFADLLLKEQMVAKHFKTRGQVIVALQAGAEVGLSPMQALKYVAPINNVPTIWGDAAKALVFKSGLVAAWEEEWLDGADVLPGDPTEFHDLITAVTRVRRHGMDGWVDRRFSVADAKRAGLFGKAGPWQTYPQRMLRVRSMAWAMRDVFADALGGLAIREEMQDTPHEPRAAEYTDVLDLLPAAASGSSPAASEHAIPAPPPESPPEFPWGSTDPEAP